MSLEVRCPVCGEELYLKHGRYGDFVGCSDFPRCRFHVSVPDYKRMEKTLQRMIQREVEKIQSITDDKVSCGFPCAGINCDECPEMVKALQRRVTAQKNEIKKLKSKKVFCIISKKDFRLFRIFSTKEKAEQYIQIYLNNDKNHYFVQKDKVLDDFKKGHINDLYEQHKNCIWGKDRNQYCYGKGKYPQILCELKGWSNIVSCNNCNHFEKVKTNE